MFNTRFISIHLRISITWFSVCKLILLVVQYDMMNGWDKRCAWRVPTYTTSGALDNPLISLNTPGKIPLEHYATNTTFGALSNLLISLYTPQEHYATYTKSGALDNPLISLKTSRKDPPRTLCNKHDIRCTW